MYRSHRVFVLAVFLMYTIARFGADKRRPRRSWKPSASLSRRRPSWRRCVTLRASTRFLSLPTGRHARQFVSTPARQRADASPCAPASHSCAPLRHRRQSSKGKAAAKASSPKVTAHQLAVAKEAERKKQEDAAAAKALASKKEARGTPLPHPRRPPRRSPQAPTPARTERPPSARSTRRATTP